MVVGTPQNNIIIGNIRGDKLLTHEIEYYRNMVDQYKKSLDGLNTGPTHSMAVKRTIEFMNRQATLRSMNLTGGNGDDKSLTIIDNNSPSKNHPTLDREGNVVYRSPKRMGQQLSSLDNEYATASLIIQNAKSEKFMLDIEKYKYKPKKETF